MGKECLWVSATMAACIIVLVPAGIAQTASTSTGVILGQPLPGLSDTQKADFLAGLQKFATVETATDGLGPAFNGTACGECHKAGAIGGAGIDLDIARERRIGAMVNGKYSDLTEVGGPVLQARSLKEFDPYCPVVGEVVPPQAQFVSGRITTPIFGAGLMEAIPDATIVARSQTRDADGVQGTPNMVFDPETNRVEVGRFGWKAQNPTLHLFAGDAYINEMGVPSTTFPHKNLPQGRPIPLGWDTGGSLSDGDSDANDFANFMRYLAPPQPRQPSYGAIQAGAIVFNQIRCSACHVPQMMTGPNAVAALSNQPVSLYSDLLLHHMGPYLADGIQQGVATGDQFRTAPLWGLSRRYFFLHDGRARTYVDAILAHGGEATAARTRFTQLSPTDHNNLVAFLNNL